MGTSVVFTNVDDRVQQLHGKVQQLHDQTQAWLQELELLDNGTATGCLVQQAKQELMAKLATAPKILQNLLEQGHQCEKQKHLQQLKRQQLEQQKQLQELKQQYQQELQQCEHERQQYRQRQQHRQEIQELLDKQEQEHLQLLQQQTHERQDLLEQQQGITRPEADAKELQHCVKEANRLMGSRPRKVMDFGLFHFFDLFWSLPRLLWEVVTLLIAFTLLATQAAHKQLDMPTAIRLGLSVAQGTLRSFFHILRDWEKDDLKVMEDRLLNLTKVLDSLKKLCSRGVQEEGLIERVETFIHEEQQRVHVAHKACRKGVKPSNSVIGSSKDPEIC